MSEIICPECHQECGVRAEDAGIGAYEYWGATGFDSRPYYVSDCCDADIPEEDLPESDFDYPDFPDDIPDYWEDQI